MKFIDLVIVELEGEKLLCQAPEFSYLKKGDKVIVGNHVVNVVASDSRVPDESDKVVQMVLGAFGIDHIADVPKLKSKVTITDFIYDEEEREGGESDE